jgi:hypothetical protein
MNCHLFGQTTFNFDPASSRIQELLKTIYFVAQNLPNLKKKNPDRVDDQGSSLGFPWHRLESNQ